MSIRHREADGVCKTEMRPFILTAAILLPSVILGKPASLSIGSAWAKPGWAVDLPVTLSGGARPAAIQWSFRYSSDVTGVTVTAGGSTTAAGKTLSCSGNTCLIFGVNTNTIADGVVAVATFQIAANPSSTVIGIVVNGVVAAEANGSSIPASGGSGKITLPGAPPEAEHFDLRAREGLLKLLREGADTPYMERRLHPRAQVQFETKVTNQTTRQSGLGRTCDISESGISVVLPFGLAEGDPVQLEMADSVFAGRVAYSQPEGAEFRIGIEVQRVQLGHSGLSSLLQRTLTETMPTLPGVEFAEPYFG